MGQRLDLQALLKTIVPNVYFQPPASLSLVYPCIVYKRDDISTFFADGKPYKHDVRYQLTVIDRSPDSLLIDKVKELPKCTYDRGYAADELNHDVFTIYF